MYHDFQAQIPFQLKASTLWIFLAWTPVRRRSPARQASQTWTPDGGQILSHYTGWLLQPRKIDMEPENDGKRKMIFLFHLNMTHLLILVVYYEVIHPKPRPFQKKHPGSIWIHPLIDSTIPPSWPDPPKKPVRCAKKQRHHLVAFFQAWPQKVKTSRTGETGETQCSFYLLRLIKIQTPSKQIIYQPGQNSIYFENSCTCSYAYDLRAWTL